MLISLLREGLSSGFPVVYISFVLSGCHRERRYYNIRTKKEQFCNNNKMVSSSSILILCLCLSSVFSKGIVPSSQVNSSNNHNATTEQNPQGSTDVAGRAESAQRSCPACSGIDCDANMSISGLPIIQVFIAFGVGVLWAKIFVWIFKNFFEKSETETVNSSSPMYGVPTPQYGVPQTQYGVAQSSYGPPASSYGAPNSRALNTDFLSLTKTVLEAIKEFTES